MNVALLSDRKINLLAALALYFLYDTYITDPFHQINP